MTLIVHHLHKSQSERITWLCEELGLQYDLKCYDRAPLLAPAEYRALHPQGTAPIIQDGDLTLAESGACIEYIYHKYASVSQGPKLFLTPDDDAYPSFLYWWHWANGTYQPTVLRTMSISKSGLDDDNMMVKMTKERFNRNLKALNERVGENDWLAGKQFTAADIMVVFSLTTMRYFFPYSLAEYENIGHYLQRVGGREAYQRAIKKSDPGMEPLLSLEVSKQALM